MPSWLNRLLCRIGAHHWDMPGGHCTECGECDEFFGVHMDCFIGRCEAELLEEDRRKEPKHE